MDKLGPMLGIYSSGSFKTWNWIIEYLSSFPEIDASLITSLIDTSPLLAEDIDVDTNEMLSLRCLEMLFGSQTSSGSITPGVPSVAFHPSRSCDDVLQSILQEVPLSNLKNVGPELSRWDGHSFIKHKRATLPKCALEKLKDRILGNIPVSGGIACPSVLSKESSPVKDVAQPEDPYDGDAVENIDQGLTLSCQNSPLTGGLQQSIDHGNKKSGMHHPCAEEICVLNKESSPVEDVALPEDPYDGDAVENIDQGLTLSCQNSPLAGGLQQSIDHGDKKFGMHHPCAEDICVLNKESSPFEDVAQPEDPYDGDAVENIDQGLASSCQNSPLAGGLQQSIDHGDKKFGMHHPCAEDICVLNKESSPFEDVAQPEDPCDGDAVENIDQGLASSCQNSPLAGGLQQSIDHGDKIFGMHHPRAEEICDCEDEISNIALQNASLTEQSCVKCNKNGQVLVCSASGCPIVVHENCLNCTVRFDDMGNFLCPYCVYSSSRYLEAENSSNARKNLDAMMELLEILRSKGEHN